MPPAVEICAVRPSAARPVTHVFDIAVSLSLKDEGAKADQQGALEAEHRWTIGWAASIVRQHAGRPAVREERGR